MCVLEIHMLGDIDIRAGNESLLSKLSTKSIAIIALLLCHENKRVAREKIISMLWAESFETASYNLRYNLWNLKKILPQDEGEDFILSTKEYCCINPKYRYESDVDRLRGLTYETVGAQDAQQLTLCKELLKGEFLDQLYIKDCESFNDWILLERTRYQKLYRACLEALYQYFRSGEKCAEAIEQLEEILKIDPYEEECHFHLMELYVQAGNRSQAILQYKKCYSLLREELNVLPEGKIRELYYSILKSGQEEDEESPRPLENILELVICGEEGCVEYQAVSELLSMIVSKASRDILTGVPRVYWMDASVLHPCVQEFIKSDFQCGPVLDIRLFQSMKGILVCLQKKYRIEILIKEETLIDQKSRSFFSFIGHMSNTKIKYI